MIFRTIHFGTHARKNLQTIRMDELKKLIADKKMPLVDLDFYACNICGTVSNASIFCCPVKGDANKGLGNFSRIVVWFKEQKVMLIDDRE